MIELNGLKNEAYALKALISLINKYGSDDTEKMQGINLVSSVPGCIPGRAIGRIFYGKSVDDADLKVIQEIINIYA
ncbi:MAG: hypothetical protein QM709_09935 [Spongiibacteraceae bacterium]